MGDIPAKTPVDILKWVIGGLLPIIVVMAGYIVNGKDTQIEDGKDRETELSRQLVQCRSEKDECYQEGNGND